MIKKLLGIVTGVFALNFLAVAAGVGFLVFTHKLDREKVQAVRAIILNGPTTAPATQPTTMPATQPSPDDTPMLRLDALLGKVSRRPAGEQIEIVRAELDVQAATIERRRREVDDQRTQLDTLKEELRKEREKLDAERQSLDTQKTADTKLAADEGFQKSLELYATLPAKKVKGIFMTLDDDTVVRYLQSMDARQAGGVLKEFKTPAETSRAQSLLEKVRRAQAKAD